MKPYSYLTCVEFEDVDAYGIAHHSRLICFLERARVHFFSDAGITVNDGSFRLVLVDMHLKFLAPAKMQDEILVHLSVEELKSASLIWRYQMLKSENHQILLEGQIKMASVGEQLKPSRFPEKVREHLELFVID